MKLFLKLLPFIATIAALRQQKEIAHRRQSFIAGYTNNIFHENPTYSDQTAQSTVNVNFNPKQSHSNYYPQKIVEANYQPANPQTQSFNVGYSVSFTNGAIQTAPPIKTPQKYQRTLDDGEIITGTRKQNEQVQVPNMNMTPEEFVSTALIDNKKHKLSGIKPKSYSYQPTSSVQHHKTLLTQANLTPTTQNYYKTLEMVKTPIVPNAQDIQQRYSWRNLSPSVEIIRSTEVPSFDHYKAIGRSQDFDYSNGIDGSAAPSTSNYFQHQIPPITRGQQPSAQINYPIDTSLLNEQIPIQIDTRLIDEAMKSQLGVYKTSNQYLKPEVVHQGFIRQQDNGYQTIPEQVRSEPMQFQDYQADQSRYQYKIYGKPQPLPIISEHVRQPRYVMDLHTNLRPPPFNTATYHRRTYY